MAVLVRVPTLGIAIANVEIIKWCFKAGEQIARGETLLEVQTDKMVMEVPAEASGVLLKVFFREEAQLTIGAPIAIIGRAGENIDRLVAEADAEIRALPAQPPEAAAALATAVESQPAPASGKVLASPVAKRLAQEKGVDLAKVQPSGARGRITQEDVLRYVEQMQAAPQPAALPAAFPALGAEADEYEVIPLKGTAKVIADNMVRSVHTSAHYTMGIEADCSLLVALRERLKDEFKRVYEVNLTYVPFMVKAIAMAVRDVPRANATIRDDNIIIQKVAHVGVAVASGDYIFVPVIRKPIAKTLLQVARELSEYRQLVQDNKLTPDHTYGGTITLTNVAVAGLSTNAGMSIINQPEVASISMGRVSDRVVPVNGEVAIRPIMNVTFSYDHRVVMGVPGARFAERVKHYLENPELLLAS